jgi:hypothetical protein
MKLGIQSKPTDFNDLTSGTTGFKSSSEMEGTIIKSERVAS